MRGERRTAPRATLPPPPRAGFDRLACALACGILLVTAGRASAAPGEQRLAGPTVECRHGVVVSVSAPASEVGRNILQRRGNAVDAAVATAFALAVTFPEAGNIGGGGFMLVYPGTNSAQPVMIDYRETAPAASTPEMFLTGKRSSYTLVGVPGTVRGLQLAHQKFGRLPWKQLIEPAVKLARDGFELDAPLARSLNNVVRRSSDFPELQRVFAKDPRNMLVPWKPDDRLIQPELAQTLQAIADRGSDAFYAGKIAEKLVGEVRSGGGILTLADLRNYSAKLREPVHGTFRGYDIYSCPPPSSGGIALVEMLNISEAFDLGKEGRWEERTLHLMIEIMRRAYCDRAKYLGDSDFVSAPPVLTTKAYAASLAKQIDLTHATPSETLGKERGISLASEGSQTTHFSIIDEQGMAVANTYTLEQSFGGRIVVRGQGFLLNNEMGDFNPQPGVTNRQGQIGTPPNQIAPGKRMLSSMSPTIVAKNGRVILVTGSPGGRTIINTVYCVTLNLLEFGMSPREAIDAPRMHEPWFPNEVTVEPEFLKNHARELESLRHMGHIFSPSPAVQGDAHTIWVDPAHGTYIGVADMRRSGSAQGY